MELKVTVATAERLDKYLAQNSPYSRETINKLISSGIVTVNQKKVKPSLKLKVDDLIFLPDVVNDKEELMAEDIKLDIIYEDQDLLVINKPSGLVVHPGSGNGKHTLVNALLNYDPTIKKVGEALRPGIVHRLDKDTSGLMLVAKSARAYELLVEAFKMKKIHREYLALVAGTFPHQHCVIEAPIGRDPKNFQRYKVLASGKYAKTTVTIEKRYPKYTLLRLSLATGRTHQIRVHLAYIGYPVFNDPVYSQKKCTDFGQFLHSEYLEFEHPITHEKLSFRVPLPAEFQNFLDHEEED